MADLGVCDFVLRRRARAARLQIDGAEHLQLLAHSKARFLVVEYYSVAGDHAVAGSSQNSRVEIVLVTEAPAGADLHGAYRWEEFKRKGDPQVCGAAARRHGLHRVFVRDGRPPQGMRAHA
jgi:hypothetical protein